MDARTRRGYEDFRRYVNPLVAMRAALCGEPFMIDHVTGGKLMCNEGVAYRDFLSGCGTQALGHRPLAVEAAMSTFLGSASPSIYPSGINPHAGRLAQALYERTGYDAAFFASGGSESVEAALKLVRASTGRPRIVHLHGAYHGCTFGSTAMMPPGPYRDLFGPHLGQVDALQPGDSEALEQALADPQLAAIVVEPIQVEAGVRVLEGRYLELLCHGTAARKVLLVADEIQTGFGRTGSFLCSERWPRKPDVVTMGKALGGGAMPLSAMLTTRAVFDNAYGRIAVAEAHASTFGGNALACVAGIAALQVLDDDMIGQVRAKGALLGAALQRCLGGHPLVAAVRGEGLLWGVELRVLDHPCYQFDYLGVPELAAQPAVGLMAVQQLYKAGFITQVCSHAWQVLRIQPPLTTQEEDLAAFVSALASALDYLWGLH